MSHITDPFTEEVNGVIVGGEYISWQLFYDGRSQSRTETATSEEEALSTARRMKNRLREEFAAIGLFHEDKWEVRFYN